MAAMRRIQVTEKRVFEMVVPEHLTGDAMDSFIEERSPLDEENEFADIEWEEIEP